jgi:hypothetical protein
MAARQALPSRQLLQGVGDHGVVIWRLKLATVEEDGRTITLPWPGTNSDAAW